MMIGLSHPYHLDVSILFFGAAGVVFIYLFHFSRPRCDIVSSGAIMFACIPKIGGLLYIKTPSVCFNTPSPKCIYKGVRTYMIVNDLMKLGLAFCYNNIHVV